VSVAEIQLQLKELSEAELNQISACLVSERRRRSGVDLDSLVERADRESRRVDWDSVKADVIGAPDSEA
jgi:hypothetical protein